MRAKRALISLARRAPKGCNYITNLLHYCPRVAVHFRGDYFKFQVTAQFHGSSNFIMYLCSKLDPLASLLPVERVNQSHCQRTMVIHSQNSSYLPRILAWRSREIGRFSPQSPRLFEDPGTGRKCRIGSQNLDHLQRLALRLLLLMLHILWRYPPSLAWINHANFYFYPFLGKISILHKF